MFSIPEHLKGEELERFCREAEAQLNEYRSLPQIVQHPGSKAVVYPCSPGGGRPFCEAFNSKCHCRLQGVI